MMRELAARLRGIPDGAKQGKWAKWLLDNGHTVDECVECLDEMLAELKDPVHWRDGKVDWGAVASNISAWKLKREGMNDEQAITANRPARVQYGGRAPVTRDYSKFGSRT